LDCNFRIFGPFLGQISVGLPLFWTAIFAFLDLFLDRSLLGCLCFGLQFFFLGELSCTGICLGALCFPPTLLCLLGLCVSIQSWRTVCRTHYPALISHISANQRKARGFQAQPSLRESSFVPRTWQLPSRRLFRVLRLFRLSRKSTWI
ncbi:hypothetical protein BKA83DRAFT_4479779, partial [Pisolithus microcarpus]